MVRTRVCMRVNNAFTHDARVYREALALSDAGYEVTIIADASDGLPVAERVGAIAVQRISKTSRIPYQSIIGPLRAVHADVYHAHDIDSLLPCLAAAKLDRRGAQVVYDSHELWSGHANDKLHAKRRMLVSIEGIMLRASDALITASPDYTQVITSRYGFKGPAVTLLNVPRFFPDAELQSSWKSRDADSHIRVTAVSIFQKGRGAIPLIRALEFLPEAYRIELVGRMAQPEYEALARAAAAPFGDRVDFVGNIPAEEVVPRIARAHISTALIEPISQSYRLTSPNKVFDSLMAGTPIVASNMPTIAQIVCSTGTGQVCDVADPRDIARAIETVYASLDTYRLAARDAARRYNWDSEKRKLLEAYERLSESATC